jgi:putative multiple sugar transport system substrate-binding protein
VVVISAIEGSSLGSALDLAKEKGIPVIAYDRLLMESDAVSYYATFDNYMVGTVQGTYIKDALDLDNAEGPFTIEFTAGSPDDNNALLFFQGAVDVLQPYIDAGKLVVKSGQTEFEQCATPAWKSETAQARMDNILTGSYSDGTKLDVALCSNDSTALGVTNSLVSFGLAADEMPIITGQDCDIPNTKNMIKGLQSMSVFKDTRTLAAQTVKMVSDILEGKEPETNATYANGVMDVPSYNCTPVFADVNNYAELLLDSGYYTADQLAD